MEMDLIIGFINLTLLEIILGIDNILFISILSDQLPKDVQAKARKIGLMGALVTRVILLLSIKWIIGLKDTLFTAFGNEFTTKDLVLISGGMFLLAKATTEIYRLVELDGHHEIENQSRKKKTMASFLLQVALVDIVFSLDSVITAVGLVNNISVMVAAVVIAIIIMMVFSETLNKFLNSNPSLKILALSFLIMVGVVLIADGFGEHINKSYIYFAMGFTFMVELLNARKRSKSPKKS